MPRPLYPCASLLLRRSVPRTHYTRASLLVMSRTFCTVFSATLSPSRAGLLDSPASLLRWSLPTNVCGTCRGQGGWGAEVRYVAD